MKLLASLKSWTQQQSFTRQFWVNTGWLFVERVLTRAIRFVAILLMINMLGPAQWGVYSYALSLIAICAAFVDLGLDEVLTRDFVRMPRKEHAALIGTATMLREVAGLIMLGVACLTIWLLRNDTLSYWLVFVLGLEFVFRPARVLMLWFISSLDAGPAVIARTLGVLVGAITQIGLALLHAPLVTFAVAQMGMVVVESIGLWSAYRKKREDSEPIRFDPAIARRLVLDSVPMLITSVAILTYMRIDQVMIGELLDDVAVGTYATVVQFTEVWYFIAAIFATSMFPGIVQHYEAGDHEKYLQRLQYAYNSVVGIGYVAVAALVLLGPLALKFLVSNAYGDLSELVRILSLSILFMSVNVLKSKWHVIERHLGLYALATSVGALANVGLNFLLIPRWGMAGAAWATVIAYSFSIYWSCFLHRDLKMTRQMIERALIFPLVALLRLRAAPRQS